MQQIATSERTRSPARDGRSARAERTMDAVVVAFLELVEEGDLHPSAQRVAERAGVSLRSVFHHFADMEALFATAAERQFRKIAGMSCCVPESLPLDERIAAFVASRTRMLEAISPVRRAAVLTEPFSHQIQGRLQHARDTTTHEVERVFSAELAQRTAADRRELLAALAAATEWPMWESLRTHQQLSLAQASRVMRRTIVGLLRSERRQ